MTALFTNNASSTLSAGIDGSSVTIQVATGTGARFPQPAGAGQFFDLVIENRRISPPTREIVRCTARSGDAMTVTRATQGTTATVFSTGAVVSNRATASGLTSLRDDAVLAQRYLGSFVASAAPTLRNDGTALQSGDMFYNATIKTIMVRQSGVWFSSDLVVGDRDVTGDLGVAGDTHLVGNLMVDGAISSGDGVEIDGAATVTGALNVGGAVTVTGAAHLGTGAGTVHSTSNDLDITGGLSVTGNTTVGGSSTVTGDQGVTGNMVVGGILSIGGTRVATLEDVSGTQNSQNLPNGNVFKWGSDATASGGFPAGIVRITYATPFPNATRKVTVTPRVIGSVSSSMPEIYPLVVYGEDRFGFSVASIATTVTTTLEDVGGDNTRFQSTTTTVVSPVGPMPFFWDAAGG